MPKQKTLLNDPAFIKGLVVGLSFAILVLIFFYQRDLKDVFAGKAGLPGNNKNPDWYMTCTGADPANPDQVAPTATMVSPLDGTYVARKSIVNFTINSSDNVSLNRNELYVNDVLRGVVYSSIAPYQQGWQVPPNATPGTVYKVYSKTCDTAGNFGVTPVISLIAQ